MEESEYKHYPLIMVQYEPGMYLEKGWWFRSAAGTMMTIIYGNKNHEHTGIPLEEDDPDLEVLGDEVLVAEVGSFGIKDQAEFLHEAINDRDMKEVLDADRRIEVWFRRPQERKGNDFVSWTIFRPQTQKEIEDARHGTFASPKVKKGSS